MAHQAILREYRKNTDDRRRKKELLHLKEIKRVLNDEKYYSNFEVNFFKKYKKAPMR